MEPLNVPMEPLDGDTFFTITTQSERVIWNSDGDNGTNGDNGANGDYGANDYNGANGDSGVNVDNGTNGDSGANGANGEPAPLLVTR